MINTSRLLNKQKSNSYIYVKVRILKLNAAVWYNKICNTKQLTSKHILIKGKIKVICMECFKKQKLIYTCVSWINKIKFYKMHSTYIKMPNLSLVLRNKTLWRTSSQPKQTNTRIFTLKFNHLGNCKCTERKTCSTFKSNITHLPCDRNLNTKFSLKHVEKYLLSTASTCFSRATFNGQNRYQKWQILCNILEKKIYMFVFHYSPKQHFKTFFILINKHVNI